MLNKKIEQFLEENNFTYLYLLLANLEAERLSNLPYSVKRNFKEKITNLALEHIAINDIPDYIIEELELMEEEAD